MFKSEEKYNVIILKFDKNLVIKIIILITF